MTLNIRGQLLDLHRPIAMAIINATPDSFYAPSRVAEGAATYGGDLSKQGTCSSPVALATRHLAEGATILDIGACSTRPGSDAVTEDEEMRRLDAVLPGIRGAFPDAIISIDTFRSSVVRHCASLDAIDIVNDVSAGTIDPLMFQTAADLHLPYILMHGYGEPENSGHRSPLPPAALARFFAARIQALHDLGVADIILDPGIGFGKSSAESFAILQALPELIRTFPSHPWLVGLSRKRIVYETLAAQLPSATLPSTPSTALNGTIVLNTVALQAGVHILRVHDTRPAMEAITLTTLIHNL